jgi:hypothetical protein
MHPEAWAFAGALFPAPGMSPLPEAMNGQQHRAQAKDEVVVLDLSLPSRLTPGVDAELGSSTKF